MPELAKPWLSQVLDPQKFDLDRLCQLLQARTEIFSQLPGHGGFLAEMPELDMALFTNKKSKSTPETSKTALEFGPSDSGRYRRLDGSQPARHRDGRHSRIRHEERNRALAAAHRHHPAAPLLPAARLKWRICSAKTRR